ncbi:MAG: histidine--tRNA ligase [Clostridia bacterium]|nr:histidine--tRNA ligase [Clostridia bacterium]
MLDCKSPVCSEIAKNAPKTTQHLCEDCKEHLDALTAILDAAEIPYVIDSGIVRGLDYYTGTVFEFIDQRIGAQSTVCGGGRYDGLVAQLGGPQMSGVGFGMGITRLVACLETEDKLRKIETKPEIYLAPAEKDAALPVFALCEKLRALGVRAETDLCSRSMKAQMKYGDKIGARYVAVIGGNELSTEKVTVKNMETGEKCEVLLTAADIAEAIK